ncbi:15952_t:CDS:1, partial [Cetraspora pellucida]
SILQICCPISVVLDLNMKLLLFNSERIIIVRKLLDNVYAQYKEFRTTIIEDTSDSSRNYFRKHCNEKLNNTSNVLEEYLIAIRENCNSLDF